MPKISKEEKRLRRLFPTEFNGSSSTGGALGSVSDNEAAQLQDTTIIEEMRRQSATEGALGALSDKEAEMLEQLTIKARKGTLSDGEARVLQKLRNDSSTGGALGSMSDEERRRMRVASMVLQGQ